jgi:hypothetical protein
MRPLDARQRPSERANGAKALRCVGGVFVDFTVLVVDINLEKGIRHGGMV